MDFTWSRGLEGRSRARRAPSRHQSSTPPHKDTGSPLSASGKTSKVGSPSSVGEKTLKLSASEPSLAAGGGGGGETKSSPLRLTATERIRLFTERNDPRNSENPPNRQFDSRRSLSKLQRELAKEGKAHDDAVFLGAKGKQGFRNFLIFRFGSILAGWRALDLDKNGRLTYYEFINACRKVGYHGHMKRLWAELDINCNGSISLMEIDPEVGRYVGTFKLALLKEYGDILTAWQKGIDINRTGRIEQKEIDECCSRLGLALDTKKLFSFLTVGPTSLGMTLADFDPEVYTRFLSGDHKGLASSRGDVEFLEDIAAPEDLPEEATRGKIKGGAKKLRQEAVIRDRDALRAAKERDSKLRPGLATLADLKQALQSRWGSLWGAWRQALDMDGNARIAYLEFSQALHRVGCHGNVKGIWSQLNPKGKDHIVFADLDPQTDALLKELKSKFVEAYGNILLGWLKGLDTRSTGMVKEEQFVKACSKLGFSGNPQQMFRVLQPDLHRNFLTVKDFDTRAYLALSRGDFRMISEPEESARVGDKPSGEKSFLERQFSCFSLQMQRAWTVAQREEFAKACRVAEPTHAVDTTEGFELLCKRTYGSLIGAWRMCLDYDGNGRLPFGEFCKALRRLGFNGNYQSLFKKYLKEGRQFITLEDIDPEAHEIVTSFLELLGNQFGGEIERGWRLGFKKDPHECIDEPILREACQALGYPHDVGKLFKCLQPMPGRQLITIWDLDPSCSRKRQRGDPAFIASPKGALTESGKRAHFAKTGESPTPTGGPKKEVFADLEAAFTGVELLRRTLRHRYGSTVMAWRLGLDPDNVGTAAFGRLSLVLDECCFHGNRKAIWNELIAQREEKSMHITFRDVDKDAQAVLESARELLLQRYGSLREAWRQALDPENIGRVGEDEFLRVWEALGFEHSWGAKRLFQLLLSERHNRAIIRDDLAGLLLGAPPAERPSMWGYEGSRPGTRSDHRSASSSSSPPRSPSRSASPSRSQAPSLSSSRPVSPEQPQATLTTPLGDETGHMARSELGETSFSLSLPWAPKAEKMYDLKFPASEIRKAVQKSHEQDVVANSLSSFKRLLRAKYASIYAAWYRVLDVDRNGLVTLRDFADACRKLGVKSMQKIWMEIDTEQKGQISLMDFDLETWEAITTLDRMVRHKYKSTQEAWSQLFDTGHKLSCDQTQFVAGCQKLGFEGDAAKTFKLLQPEPGRTALLHVDIWLDETSKTASRPISPK